ncbi:MAG: hypothetical protein Q9167_007150 [Letrouitia subvulpina]
MRPFQSLAQPSNSLRQLLQHKTIPIRCYFSTTRVFLRRPPTLQLLPRSPKDTSIRHLVSRRFNSQKPQFNPTENLGSPEPALSLSQRLRKLSREYGWSALGVYLLLTALDFPFCFLAVRWLGTDRIGRWESAILDVFWSIIPFQLEPLGGSQASESESTEKRLEEYRVAGPSTDATGAPIYDHGLKEAEQRNRSGNASIWTQLALAYAIHKSFIFVRVPLTAAVTPKVVKTLRGWGWDIGKRRPKNIQATDKS